MSPPTSAPVPAPLPPLRRRRLGTVLLAPLTLVLWRLPVLALADESAVLSLDAGSFDTALSGNPLLAVEFYAPWCGHCKNLEPEFEKAANALKGRITFAKVDATVEIELVENFKIDGYPTVLFFLRGQEARPEQYTGARKNASIVEWMLGRAGTAMTSLTSEDDWQTRLAGRRAGSFFLARGPASLGELVGRVAEENRAWGSFFFLEADATADSAPTLEVHRGSDAEVVTLSGEETMQAQRVVEFVHAEALPLFGEVNENNYNTYMLRRPSGMLWLCLKQTSDLQDEFLERAKPVFRAVVQGQPSWSSVFVSGEIFAEHVSNELGCEEFPMAVLQIGDFTAQDEEPKRFRLPLKDPAALDGLFDWVAQAADGSLAPDDLEAAAADEQELDEDELDALAGQAASSSTTSDEL